MPTVLRAKPIASIRSRGRRGAALVAVAFAASACATLGSLGNLIRPPRVAQAPDRSPELRLVGPGAGRPLGGAAVRLWAEVENPNGFGLTLSTLAGDLYLEDSASIAVDFPLGVPLRAGETTVIPLDVSLGFEDLPGLARAGSRAVTGSSVGYRLEGTIGVDAGPFGTPTFGPLTLLEGDMRVRR